MRKTIVSVLCLLISLFVAGCSFFDDSEFENQQNNKIDDFVAIEKEVGETFSFCDVDLTIQKYIIREQCLSFFPANPESTTIQDNRNNVWVEIYIKIENNTPNNFSVSQIMDTLIYVTEQGNASYNSYYNYAYDEFIDSHSRVEAFGSLSGIYAYKIPVAIAPKLKDNKSYLYPERATYNSETTQNINFSLQLKDSKNLKKDYIRVNL